MDTFAENAEFEWMEEKESVISDFNSLKRKHHISGFREGLSAGQNYILQSAFNTGFTLSAEYFEDLSKLRGSLSALLMFLGGIKDFPSDICQKLEAVILQLEDFESRQFHIDALQSGNNGGFVKAPNTDDEQKICKGETSLDQVIDSMETMSSLCDKEEKDSEQDECCSENKASTCSQCVQKESSCSAQESAVCNSYGLSNDNQISHQHTLQCDITTQKRTSNLPDHKTRCLQIHLETFNNLACSVLIDVQNACSNITVKEKIHNLMSSFGMSIEK